MRSGLLNFRHQRTVGAIGNGSGDNQGQIDQRRQFRQRRGVGPQIRDRLMSFTFWKRPRLVIEQQQDRIRRINQRFTAAGTQCSMPS